jgi:LPXTG-motif cell wall-anchored protein
MTGESHSGGPRSPWLGVTLLAVAVGLFILAVLLSLADTGASTNWYMWAALAAAATAAAVGVKSLIRR